MMESQRLQPSKAEQLSAFLKEQRLAADEKWKNLPLETRRQVSAERLQAWVLPNCLHSQDGMEGDWSMPSDSTCES